MRSLQFRVGFGDLRALFFGQTCQPLRCKTLHPVYDTPGRVAQQFSDRWAGHALRHEEDSVEAMIVARCVVAPNLIPQSHDRVFFVRDVECFH